MNKAICLGKFKNHSFSAWNWRTEDGGYHRACNLYGCSHTESAISLRPVGRARIVDKEKECTEVKSVCSHMWLEWGSTADRLGVYKPPFAYRRTCAKCSSSEEVEQLEIES